ncbi:MAG: hypothetical protein MJ252_06765 [archaeon]|nr:hypothetical protein [archaeon]
MKTQIEESKNLNREALKTQPNPIERKNPLKRNVLHLTDKHLLKRIDYDKQISPLRGLTREDKKRDLKMTEEEKEVNRKILYNMNLKLNFVKNPRYKDIPNFEPFDKSKLKPINSRDNPFSVEPQVVIFRDYQPGNIYQIEVRLINRTGLLKNFKYIPPQTEHFAIKEIIYPKKDSALIAAGMHAKLMVIFTASALENYSDDIIIRTEKMSFSIPLRALKDKPALSLINPMDCKKCFIGDRIESHFACKNNGGDGHFKFYIDDDENQETENGNFNELLNVGPFTVFPQEFYLYKGMTQNISINFSPETEGVVTRNIHLLCENCELTYTLRGEGIKVDISLKKVDGLLTEDPQKKDKKENKKSNKENKKETDSSEEFNEVQDEELEDNDVGDDKNNTFNTLYFKDTFPYTTSSRTIVMENLSSVPVKFHWSIYDIYHQNEFTITPDENYFSIEPEDGTFKPFEELIFTLTFKPINSIIYEQKLDLVIENIPFPAIKQFNSASSSLKNNLTKAEPYLPGFNSSFPSYPLYSFTLNGKGRLPDLEINKTFIDMGEIYIGEECSDSFEVSNIKTGQIKFKVNKIIQKLLTQKEEDSGLCRLYNDRGLNNDSIFKEKKSILEKSTVLERDYKEEDSRQTNCLFTDVQCLTLNIDDYKKNPSPEDTLQNTSQTSKQFYKKKESTLPKVKTKKRSLQTEYSGFNKLPSFNTSIKKECPIDKYLEVNKDYTYCFGIKVKGIKMGFFKSSILFTLDDGKAFAVDIIAKIIPPKILINTPLINFGIFALSKVQKQEFEIENPTPVPFHYLIKESRFKDITLRNFSDKHYLEDFEGEIKENEIKYKNKIETILEYDTQYMDEFDIEKIDCYQMKFSNCFGEILPGEKKTIEVYFSSPYAIHIEKDKTIEVEVENGLSDYINYIAQCEQIEAYIENTIITPKEIFLSQSIKGDNDNKIFIINPSNLPIHFKWDNVYEADHRMINFEPFEGEIPPHSKQEIKYSMKYFYLGRIDDLFMCHIEEIEFPLGVVLQGEVIGLEISYEFTEESFELVKEANKRGGGGGASFVGGREGTKRVSTRRKSRLSSMISGEIENDPKRLQMRRIMLRNLKINTPFDIYFKIKNLSGISTVYNLGIQKNPPGKEKPLKTDKDRSSSVSSLTKLSKITKQKGFKIDHPLLTAANEKINFTSEKGLEFTKQRQIEEDSDFYLENTNGLAIIIEPKRGKLRKKGEALIKMTFFNNCVGEFEDTLVSNIKGLPPVEFPINVRIKGNPLQLSPFQAGVNYLVSPEELKMGSMIVGGNPIRRKIRILNIGTNTVCLDWKIYDNNDVLHPKNRNIFDIKIVERMKGHFHLNFNIAEPNEFQEVKYFSISPEHAEISPKDSYDFTITFSSDEIGDKTALFIAYPYTVNSEGEKQIVFSELPLKVIGNTLNPKLCVDKLKDFEGKTLYKFLVYSYGPSPRPKRSIILINKEKINMEVDISIEGPFKIERTEPFEATIGKMKYNIIPNSNLKLDIRYLMPSPQNEAEWPMLLHVEKDGKMTVRFQNGVIEEYFLKAILKRPRLILSLTGNQSKPNMDDCINFGYVNCASKKIEEIYLMDETEVPTNWKISFVKFIPKTVYGYGTMTEKEKEDQNMLEDPSVFNFEMTEGVIYGPTDMLINLPIGPGLPKLDIFENKKYKPLTIKVMFTPKKNVFYKCRYKITTSTGNSIDFTLKGNGSYREEHMIK